MYDIYRRVGTPPFKTTLQQEHCRELNVTYAPSQTPQPIPSLRRLSFNDSQFSERVVLKGVGVPKCAAASIF